MATMEKQNKNIKLKLTSCQLLVCCDFTSEGQFG